MIDLTGKVAFVTGGASGIGYAIAAALADEGMHVAVAYRTHAHLDEAMSRFRAHPHRSIHPVHVDVTDRESVHRAAAETQRRFGKIHLLCNSAGVNLLGPMDQATPEDWDWILGVNLHGVVNTLMSFVPLIKAHGEGGHVINVGSMACFIVGANSGVYAASKFAVRGLSESLRLTLGPHRIGVSLVCPGLTQSYIYEAPLRRPPHLANTGFPMSTHTHTLSRLENVHSFGMDAGEVARKTIDAVRNNRFYVFTHPEFREEVRELATEVDMAMPDEQPDPIRLGYEVKRRRAAADARRVADALSVGCS
jgi:NAD(P)-dependent dehydrogenase (short-subunit alcohol dehydrogenase family)